MVKKVKKDADEFKGSLTAGLRYPWNKAARLLNILWALIPIFGWFALIGYVKAIVRELAKGRKKELPSFGSFWTNFKEGVVVFIFMIPTFLVLGMINFVPFVGNVIALLAEVFLLPWLVINFFVKDTFDALWDVRKAFDIVFDNVKDYLWAYLKTLVFALIYGLLSIVLVGIPCYTFGVFYFLADFYKNYK